MRFRNIVILLCNLLMTLVFTTRLEVGRGEPPDPLRIEECVPGHKQNKLLATGLTPAKT